MSAVCTTATSGERPLEKPGWDFGEASPSLIEVNGAVIIVPYAARAYPHDFSERMIVSDFSASYVHFPWAYVNRRRS